MAGRFITFEGIDGAGKSTQIRFLADLLRGRGIDVLLTREPGGTELGETLRTLVLNTPMTPVTETLLMFAARAEHVAQVIRPALADGRWVLCDRFTDATYAYQVGGRGLDATPIGVLADWVHPGLQPDRTFLMDVAPEIAAERLARARASDRFESEQRDFFTRVREQYLQRAAAEPQRFVRLDGAAAPADVQHAIRQAIEPWLV